MESTTFCTAAPVAKHNFENKFEPVIFADSYEKTMTHRWMEVKLLEPHIIMYLFTCLAATA